MRSVKLGFFFVLILGLEFASAQLSVFTPPKPQPLWKADTLYIGASFTRTSLDPVYIWLIGNEAGWTGNLYFIVPKTGQEVFLFTNHDKTNVKTNLSARYDIPLGDTVYFKYQVVTPANGTWPSEESRKPKYTGLNIPGVSKYVSPSVSAKYGHRWSVAGRVNDSLVQFGFEDNTNAPGTPNASDMDFDDIIFGTTLSLTGAEVPARLYFTDKTGKVLDPGAFYSPANDTVYLTYTDDYGRDALQKEFVLKVKNRKGLAAPDSESVLVLASGHNGASGTWTAAIPVQELPGKPGDKILQSYFLGEVTATVKSHNRFSLPDGNTVTAELKLAYPDQPEAIRIVSCPDSAAEIVRTTTCIGIRVSDQSFTRNPDTVWAEVKCDLSGDVIGRVALLEQPGGGYVSGNIVKNEGAANPADNVLSCKTSDNITVTYADEVYNNQIIQKAVFKGDAPEGLNFAEAGNPAAPITSIKDGEADSFLVVVKGASATVGVKDTILVTLTSSQGESEVVKAVETDVNSNIFTVTVGFEFQTAPPAKNSGKLEAYLNPSQVITKVDIKGEALIGGQPYTAIISLLPSLNLVTKAYIKDTDGDGRGDKVFIVFNRPVETLPSSLSPTYWNQLGPAFANAKPPIISLLDGFPGTVVADFSASPFPKGATSIPAGQRPFVSLPADNVFGAQRPAIADSMGPIIDSAIIRPFNNLNVTTGATVLNVDTMVIYVSELMQTRSDWQELIRFSKPVNGACTDYARSLQVNAYSQPKDNRDGSFVILVASGKGPSPLSGDCVYLNVNGTYTDTLANLPPIHGEILRGKRPPRVIELFRGYPPVVGMDANRPGFTLINNDARDDQGSEFSKNVNGRFTTQWVPPADYVSGQPYNPAIPNLQDNPIANGDAAKWETMPLDIGSVQVISTSEYIADVVIYDNLGNWVKSFKQAFGYRGEMNNQERAANRGLVSFLVWDLKDHRNQQAGQGVYVWKVVFRFKNGKQEIRYTRTGVTRTRNSLPLGAVP